jgi:hypothetical protein
MDHPIRNGRPRPPIWAGVEIYPRVQGRQGLSGKMTLKVSTKSYLSAIFPSVTAGRMKLKKSPYLQLQSAFFSL